MDFIHTEPDRRIQGTGLLQPRGVVIAHPTDGHAAQARLLGQVHKGLAQGQGFQPRDQPGGNAAFRVDRRQRFIERPPAALAAKAPGVHIQAHPLAVSGPIPDYLGASAEAGEIPGVARGAMVR